MRPVLTIVASSVLLSGCVSTSFAPPQVDVHHATTSGGLGCALSATGLQIGPNVDGAQLLVSNYLDSYRCAMRAAANGRQPWEILSFLSLLAATTATALGAGKNVAIVGASANSLFTAGNGYYAPRDQTAILNDAVDALACIQDESVGIDPFELKTAASAQMAAFSPDQERGPTISVTAERQYFNMVYSALITTERAAAKRLESRGFDAAGIQAQIDALTEKIKQAQAAKDAQAGKDGKGGNATGTQNFYAEMESRNLTEQSKALHTVQLDLGLMKPKLEKCALRAQGAG